MSSDSELLSTLCLMVRPKDQVVLRHHVVCACAIGSERKNSPLAGGDVAELPSSMMTTRHRAIPRLSRYRTGVASVVHFTDVRILRSTGSNLTSVGYTTARSKRDVWPPSTSVYELAGVLALAFPIKPCDTKGPNRGPTYSRHFYPRPASRENTLAKARLRRTHCHRSSVPVQACSRPDWQAAFTRNLALIWSLFFRTCLSQPSPQPTLDLGRR